MANIVLTFLNKFFQRIIKDFQYKQLLPLKLLFFVHASTIFVLYPYLTIHMRELGINVEETAIMSAVTPVVAIIMPPMAGMIADKIGNFKVLLSIFSALGGASALLLLLVPVGRITITYPERLIMDVGCTGHDDQIVGSSFDQLNFNLIETDSCDQTDISSTVREVEARLESCGFVCQPFINENNADLQRVLMARTYDVVLAGLKGSNASGTSYSYTLTSDDMPQILTDDMRNHKIIKNNEHFRTSIRNLTNFSYFFPTTGLYNLNCNLLRPNESNTSGSSYQCDFGVPSDVKEGVSSISAKRDMFGVNLMPVKGDKKQFYAPEIEQWSGEIRTNDKRNATCTDFYENNKQIVIVNIPLHNPENNLEVEKILRMGDCQPRCLATLPRKQMCSNFKAEIDYNIRFTFWMYLCIRVFIGVIGGTAFAMFEGAVIAILREHNADYGLQRIYATIGGMISSPLSGLLIDYASRGKGYTDFRPAFYLYAFLKLASALLMLTINLEFKVPATNVIRDVLTVLKNVEIVALFIAIFVLGTAWGYIESFLFWLLQDLGASRSLMGITITVGGIAGIPLLVLSGPIINKIGHANVLFIGFIFYAIRLTGYSLIYDPWLCLIFEAMESVTSSLSFTAAVTYAAKLSTTTTDTSIQGLLGGLYYGVGKGSGSLIGGYLMKGFGTRQTYRIFAVMCLVVGAIYFIFNTLYLRRRPEDEQKGNDIVKKKPKNVIKDMVEIDLGDGKLEKEQLKNEANRDINKTVEYVAGDSKKEMDGEENCMDDKPKVEEKCYSINLGYEEDGKVENIDQVKETKPKEDQDSSAIERN